ncbi:hypothetical protein ABZX92_45875 [Lentzea sp. NPDC006480]
MTDHVVVATRDTGRHAVNAVPAPERHVKVTVLNPALLPVIAATAND